MARNKKFIRVKNDFMLVYKWKDLRAVPLAGNADDHYFTDCQELAEVSGPGKSDNANGGGNNIVSDGGRRVIVTKIEKPSGMKVNLNV